MTSEDMRVWRNLTWGRAGWARHSHMPRSQTCTFFSATWRDQRWLWLAEWRRRHRGWRRCSHRWTLKEKVSRSVEPDQCQHFTQLSMFRILFIPISRAEKILCRHNYCIATMS